MAMQQAAAGEQGEDYISLQQKYMKLKQEKEDFQKCSRNEISKHQAIRQEWEEAYITLHGECTKLRNDKEDLENRYSKEMERQEAWKVESTMLHEQCMKLNNAKEELERRFCKGMELKQAQDIEHRKLQELYMKLMNKKEELENRFKQMLTNSVGGYQHTENINDPCRESNLLHLYEQLTLQGWDALQLEEKVTYKDGSSMIKNAFHAAEEEITSKLNAVLSAFEVPVTENKSADSMIAKPKFSDTLLREIKCHLRTSYFGLGDHSYWELTKAACYKQDEKEKKETLCWTKGTAAFASECCRLFCLLLLLTPEMVFDWGEAPVMKFRELYHKHVALEPLEEGTPVCLLWPLLLCKEVTVKKCAIVYTEPMASHHASELAM